MDRAAQRIVDDSLVDIEDKLAASGRTVQGPVGRKPVKPEPADGPGASKEHR